MNILSFKQISLAKTVQNRTKEILDSVSFNIKEAQICTIIGPSGAGKSSLLRLANRLTDPTGGEIWFDEQDIRTISIVALRRKIGLVFQKPVFFSGSVRDNICYGTTIRGERLPNPEKYLEMVGMEPEVMDWDAAKLSGGQQQRVALARALANQPKILLLDEPTSALDPQAADHLESLILSLRETLGLTVLWVTHNLEQAKRVGDKTVLLVAGKVVEEESTQQFFETPSKEITRLFLAGKSLFEGAV